MNIKNLSEIDSYSYKPLRKQVYEVLREGILTGKIKPGEKLTEVDIAQKLNVSRTPVREAIRMLELEDFVVVVPRQGIFVAGIKSIEEINDIFQVRVELEGLAAYLTAKNIRSYQIKEMEKQIEQLKDCIKQNDLEKCIEIDIAFHQIIYEASKNKWLQKLLDSLFEQITRFRSESLAREGRLEQALEEHQELLDAIIQKDGKLAREIVCEHIENARKSVISVFEKKYQESQ